MKKHYDIQRIIANAELLSDSTIADCFYYECDDVGGVQDVLDEIQEFSASLPDNIGWSDLEDIICGNKKTKIYGRAVCSPTCGHLIAQGNDCPNRIMFENKGEAVSMGYRPCARCMAEEYEEWRRSQAE